MLTLHSVVEEVLQLSDGCRVLHRSSSGQLRILLVPAHRSLVLVDSLILHQLEGGLIRLLVRVKS